jgi:predicted Zn-dependent peptidase
MAALAEAGWDPEAVAAPTARRDTAPGLVGGTPARTIVERPLEQANLMLGVPALSATDERRPVLVVLNAILGSGMSSRLFQEVRERRGLAYSVYSFSSGYADAGILGLYAGCSPRNAGAVAELMLAELRRLADEPVSAEELARAQGQLGGSSALALEDTDTRMTRLGRSEITHGEFADLDETLRRIGAVTAEQIQALAADLTSRPLSLAAVGPLAADAFDQLTGDTVAA